MSLAPSQENLFVGLVYILPWLGLGLGIFLYHRVASGNARDTEAENADGYERRVQYFTIVIVAGLIFLFGFRWLFGQAFGLADMSRSTPVSSLRLALGSLVDLLALGWFFKTWKQPRWLYWKLLVFSVALSDVVNLGLRLIRNGTS